MTNAQEATGVPSGVLAALLNDSRLSAYFHADTAPERFPLQIVDTGFAGLSAPGPGNVDYPAVLVPLDEEPDPSRAVLFIDSVELDGSPAIVSFRFPIEGISGEARLTLAGADWTVTEITVVEQ